MLEVTMRVATRHVIANKLRDDPQETAAVFRRRLDKFATMWGDESSDSNPYVRESMKAQLETLIHYGRALAAWAVDTRAIPGGQAKAFEMAARSVMSAGVPRQPAAWWVKHRRHLELLSTVIDWPDRGGVRDDVQEVFDISGLRVHNTLHLSGAKLEKTCDVIEKVVRLLSRQPKTSRVLYGDVFVVGQIARSKRMAWYDIKTDRIYLRPHLRFGPGDVHNLVHEFGHRLWFKFIPKSGQDAWRQAYQDVQDVGGRGQVELPKVGDPLPVLVRGFDEPPTITRIEGSRYYVESGGFLTFDDLWRNMRQQRVVAQFPTPYAAQDAQEYFAESFALHILGMLAEPHEASIEKVLGSV